MSLDKNADILSNLECPICTEYMLTSIYICSRGHSICSKCKSNLQKCPTCSVVLGSTRNYALESLVSQLKYPCAFAHQGCKETLSPTDLRMHERNCPDRIRECPFCREDSVWTGHIGDLQVHLLERHKSSILMTNTKRRLKTNFLPDGPMKYFLYDNDHKAMFHLLQTYDDERGIIGYYVRYLGDKERAKNFKFTLSICSKSERSRNITITEFCHDEVVSFDDIIQSGIYIGLLKSVLCSYSDGYCILSISARSEK